MSPSLAGCVPSLLAAYTYRLLHGSHFNPGQGQCADDGRDESQHLLLGMQTVHNSPGFSKYEAYKICVLTNGTDGDTLLP